MILIFNLSHDFSGDALFSDKSTNLWEKYLDQISFINNFWEYLEKSLSISNFTLHYLPFFTLKHYCLLCFWSNIFWSKFFDIFDIEAWPSIIW